MLYKAVDQMYGSYTFSPLPLYNASGETQSRFEETVKNILSIAHRDYISRTEHGDDPESVMQELLESSLFGNLGNCSIDAHKGGRTMLLRLKEMKAALAAAQTQGVSMRRRLMIYLLPSSFFRTPDRYAAAPFGAITPIGYEIERALDNQLKNSANLLECQGNDQAAYALDFSQQITEAVRNELTDAGITFDQLRNHPDAWNPCKTSF